MFSSLLSLKLFKISLVTRKSLEPTIWTKRNNLNKVLKANWLCGSNRQPHLFTPLPFSKGKSSGEEVGLEGELGM